MTRTATRRGRSAGPLLAVGRREGGPATGRENLSDTEAHQLRASALALLDRDHPSQAISLLEDAVERAAHDPALRLRMRDALAAALFYAGQYTRAASLFEAVGHDYMQHLPPTHPVVLDCSYHAGHAYAETGKPHKALPHLRFYAQNADPSASADEARKILESRFVIGQMLAAAGRSDEALAGSKPSAPGWPKRTAPTRPRSAISTSILTVCSNAALRPGGDRYISSASWAGGLCGVTILR